MANEALQAATAANQDVPAEKPGPFQDCRDVVHISIFFDGTGNNKDEDNASTRWSNVARVYFSAQTLASPSKAVYTIYVSGVGTPYNGDAAGWMSSTGVWLEDNVGGMAAGAGGDRRLDQGDDRVSARLRDVLISNAKALGGAVAKYAAAAEDKSFSEVNAKLSAHRLIKKINLSILGFSRGAALARAFSNRVISQCVKKENDLEYAGYPLEINFLGLFDTVASFGVPSQNVRLPFQERDLIVSPSVKRCVHFVAAHEVRFSFPVDLIRKNGTLAGDWLETTYPGVHSDVGGGYEPFAQEIDNNYARIPMKDMMRESLMSGVRVVSYDDLRQINEPLFKVRHECKPATLQAYRDYMAAVGALGGTIESQMQRHMKVFFSANGTMSRSGIQSPGDRSRGDSTIKSLGPKGMAWEVDTYRKAQNLGKWTRIGGGVVNTYAQYIKPQDWQLEAWDRTASTAVVQFVSHYVHDSKVDFIMNVEPFSYFKARGVQESTISIWQEGGNWIYDKAEVVSEASKAAYEAGKNKAEAAVDATTKAAKEAADAAQRKAKQAADYAQEKAAQAADAANRAYDATAKAAREAADEAKRKAEEIATAAQHKAQQAAEFARRKAQEAEAAAGRAYDATKTGVSKAAAAGARKVDEVEEGAERLYDHGINWIKHTAQDAGNEISDAAKRAKKKLSFSD